MNKTNLNSALLATEARGRKHVPIAVIAVILIHIALFLVLLVAAGCRAKARAKEKALQEQELAKQQVVQTNIAPAALPSAHPPVVRTPALEPAPAPRVATYIVQPGDNLGAIARKHGTTVNAIKDENNLQSDFIKAGQELRVRLESPTNAELASR